MHNRFYVSIFLLLMALTGMTFGIEWYAKGLYRIASGGKEIALNTEQSDSTNIRLATDPMLAVDSVFEMMIDKYPQAASIYINLPDTANPLSVIRATIYPEKGISYNREGYVFDRYTMEEIKSKELYNGRYQDADFAGKLFRAIYDLHIGSFWGTPGRILYIIAALLGATFPITGLYMWYKRSRRKKMDTSLYA
ncbi:hypothetical protein EZS27_036735 [termite gut metagenome]|uniref:PepSY domain-containing protein n=1 Tax=termite gut metagenome TaxID=433724 RepID=A0A5J4PVJ0_9ZZZZ